MCTSSAHQAQSGLPQGLQRHKSELSDKAVVALRTLPEHGSYACLRLCCTPRILELEMTKPSRILRWLLAGLLLLLLLAGGFAWYQWTAFKREQGIVELDWQGLRVSSRSISIRQLDYAQLTENGLNLTVRAENIALQVPSLFQPFPPQSLQIDRLSTTLLSLPHAGNESSPPRDAEQYARWGAWLPQRMTIADLRMDLPCAKVSATNGVACGWNTPAKHCCLSMPGWTCAATNTVFH